MHAVVCCLCSVASTATIPIITAVTQPNHNLAAPQATVHGTTAAATSPVATGNALPPPPHAGILPLPGPMQQPVSACQQEQQLLAQQLAAAAAAASPTKAGARSKATPRGSAGARSGGAGTPDRTQGGGAGETGTPPRPGLVLSRIETLQAFAQGKLRVLGAPISTPPTISEEAGAALLHDFASSAQDITSQPHDDAPGHASGVSDPPTQSARSALAAPPLNGLAGAGAMATTQVAGLPDMGMAGAGAPLGVGTSYDHALPPLPLPSSTATMTPGYAPPGSPAVAAPIAQLKHSGAAATALLAAVEQATASEAVAEGAEAAAHANNAM